MKKRKKFIKVLFPKPTNMGKRNWGSEILLTVIPKILSLKILNIKKGKKGNLQYHHLKNECGYILSGKLLIRYDNGKGILKEKILVKGKCFHFPPGAVHQEEAITNVKILEASSPHFNDRVRVENLYSLKEEFGLPSTGIKDVKIK
jgi:mannose-6-phosphate isomerase-like protein (cupin superfamily)